ncbi:MAG: Chemotaxis response regulator protein-glutamate methylesterase of group 3 operon [Syntrophorhabdus sp. PtaU1.Bin058]|nr:MAG: Chemotaxis response regulator protein-glutamate methylesterase of group 3 operon [Syntrophorhabdus sp. PtaU1.Bin058]
MEAGAIAAIKKPVGVTHPDYRNQVKELIQTVKLMSEVKVIKRRRQAAFKKDIPDVTLAGEPARPVDHIRTVAIGASTGGPPAVEAILSRLPKDFRASILIVQHIAPGFVHGFAEWLENACKFPVKIAEQGEIPFPAHAYVAPDDVHMGVSMSGRIVLSTDAPENGLRPSVSYLFRSAADVFGRNAVGVLLTGMGKDGAYELKTMQERGAVTIAQDKESSVVYGMPGEAVALGAAMHVLSPDDIAVLLKKLVGDRWP